MAFDFATAGERMQALDVEEPGLPRGQALEVLVADMLGSVPGVRVAERNVLACSGVEELDLLLANRAVDDGLIGFTYDLLVECKTQKAAINSHTVGWFAQQLRRRSVEWGLLVSLKHITGDRTTVTAAHREIERSAVEGQRILVLMGDELRGLSSAGHLVALLQRKRDAMVGGYGTFIASASQLSELNPNRGLGVLRGWEAMQRAVLNMRRRQLKDVLDAATAMEDLLPDMAVALAEQRLAKLAAEVCLHTDDPDYDPMWRTAYSKLEEAAAAIVHILEPTPRTEEQHRAVQFQIEGAAPQRLRAHAGSRLWGLLMDYYLEEARRPDSYVRESTAHAMLALAVEELMAIDDIEPPDAYME
jgi:hypothetical protein